MGVPFLIKRLKGYDVNAIGRSNNYGYEYDYHSFDPVASSVRTNKSVQDVKNELVLEGDNSSAIVIIHVPGTNTEHAIVAVNRNNRISFIDPQAQNIVDLQPTLNLDMFVAYDPVN